MARDIELLRRDFKILANMDWWSIKKFLLLAHDEKATTDIMNALAECRRKRDDVLRVNEYFSLVIDSKKVIPAGALDDKLERLHNTRMTEYNELLESLTYGAGVNVNDAT